MQSGDAGYILRHGVCQDVIGWIFDILEIAQLLGLKRNFLQKKSWDAQEMDSMFISEERIVSLVVLSGVERGPDLTAANLT